VFIINLTSKEVLNEGFLRAWGHWNKALLKYVYGKDTPVVANLNEEEKNDIEFKITGEYEDVKSYARALSLEAQYLRSYIENGKEHKETQSIKAELNKASADFVNKTGLPWPFKD
jgi:hypothetical protein